MSSALALLQAGLGASLLVLILIFVVILAILLALIAVLLIVLIARMGSRGPTQLDVGGEPSRPAAPGTEAAPSGTRREPPSGTRLGEAPTMEMPVRPESHPPGGARPEEPPPG